MLSDATPPAGTPGAASGGRMVSARTRCEYTPTPDRAPTDANPWRTTATRLGDDQLAEWLADLKIIETDAPSDDPVSVSTREIATLMRQAAAQELALRRRASARKPAPTGGLPREHHQRLREQIRHRIDLVALVREEVPDLRRSGSSWRGRCPLHDDREPSLVVWPERGRWRCFGCGAGGDAVAWLLATRPQLDFRSALTYAAQLAGIALTETVAWPSWRRNRQEPRIRLEGGKVVAG